MLNQSTVQLFAGHVRPPLSACVIKLVDVPEKECFVKGGRGEVCFLKLLSICAIVYSIDVFRWVGALSEGVEEHFS